MKLPHWTLGLAVVLASLVGCGEGSKEAKGVSSPNPSTAITTTSSAPPVVHQLSITLAGRGGPESVGIVMADERGYFAEEGLEVSVLTPVFPTRPIRYVVNRLDNLGVSHLPQVAIARAKGVPIVAVGSIVPRPSATMIWLKGSKIHGIEDLRGKTIAIPGLPFQEPLLESVLRRAGIQAGEVKILPVLNELVPSLVSGRADAIFGGSEYVESIELESRGLDPVVTPVAKLGVPAYEELVVIARRDFAARHPQLIRNFMAGVQRGTAAAIRDPRTAALVLDESSPADPKLSRRELEAGVDAVQPLLSRTGYMSPRKARRLVRWMHAQNLIRRAIPATALLTNRYIPIPITAGP